MLREVVKTYEIPGLAKDAARHYNFDVSSKNLADKVREDLTNFANDKGIFPVPVSSDESSAILKKIKKVCDWIRNTDHVHGTIVINSKILKNDNIKIEFEYDDDFLSYDPQKSKFDVIKKEQPTTSSSSNQENPEEGCGFVLGILLIISFIAFFIIKGCETDKNSDVKNVHHVQNNSEFLKIVENDPDFKIYFEQNNVSTNAITK